MFSIYIALWYGSAGEVWPKLIYYAGDRPDLALPIIEYISSSNPLSPSIPPYLPDAKNMREGQILCEYDPSDTTIIQIYLVPKNLWNWKFQYHQHRSVKGHGWVTIMIMIQSIVMLTRAGNRGPMGCHRWKPTPQSIYHTNIYHHRAVKYQYISPPVDSI